MNFEETMEAEDGTIRWVRTNKLPLKNSRGDTFGIIETYEDVTERILAERALRESENQLSRIYNNVSDVIFVLAVEPNDNFRFISINKRFLEVTRVSEKQILGKPYQEVIPKPAHALVLGNYKKAILTKKTVQWEETSVYPTGNQNWRSVHNPRF